jgi:hypothetical protein
MSGGTVTPQVTISNPGTSDQATWSVTLTDGTYTSTKADVATIVAGADLVVDMDAWTPADGVHTLTATVTLTGDVNTANDVLTQDVNVTETKIAYTINASTEQFASLLLPVGVETNIAAISVANFPMAMEYAADGNYYVIRYSPAVLSTIDITTGVETVIGTMSGITGTPTGLAYNWDTDVMYVCVLNGSNLPQLGTIDLSTAVATLIGTGAEGMLIAIEFDNAGNLYGPALTPDNFYQIDLTNGATTSIGALGVDINYGQDISFDKEAGIMYGTLIGGFGSGLFTIDLTTGAATQLVNLNDEQHAGFAIPYIAASVNDIASKGISVYPNPSNGVFTVNANEVYNLQVLDLTGKLISTQVLNGNGSVSINNAGVYFLKFSNEKGSVTQRVIVK